MVPPRFLLVSKFMRNNNPDKAIPGTVCYMPNPSIVGLNLKEKKLYGSVN